MATQTLPAVFIPDHTEVAEPSLGPSRGLSLGPSLLRRIYDVMVETQTRRAEQMIARYRQDGRLRFTPDVNREPQR